MDSESNVGATGYVVDQEKTPFECARFKVQEILYRTNTREKELRKTWKLELAGDLVVIVPRFKDKIVLVEEVSPPLTNPSWTFPIGFIVGGMPVGDTTQAILLEKTGLVAQRFAYLGQMIPSRYIKNKAHIFAADGIQRQANADTLKSKVGLFTETQLGSLLINRTLDDGLALASYAYYVTSNYYAEVHGAPNDSDRRTQANG